MVSLFKAVGRLKYPGATLVYPSVRSRLENELKPSRAKFRSKSLSSIVALKLKGWGWMHVNERLLIRWGNVRPKVCRKQKREASSFTFWSGATLFGWNSKDFDKWILGWGRRRILSDSRWLSISSIQEAGMVLWSYNFSTIGNFRIKPFRENESSILCILDLSRTFVYVSVRVQRGWSTADGCFWLKFLTRVYCENG